MFAGVARAASPRFAFEMPFRPTQAECDCGRDESRESDSHEAQSGCACRGRSRVAQRQSADRRETQRRRLCWCDRSYSPLRASLKNKTRIIMRLNVCVTYASYCFLDATVGILPKLFTAYGRSDAHTEARAARAGSGDRAKRRGRRTHSRSGGNVTRRVAGIERAPASSTRRSSRPSRCSHRRSARATGRRARRPRRRAARPRRRFATRRASCSPRR